MSGRSRIADGEFRLMRESYRETARSVSESRSRVNRVFRGFGLDLKFLPSIYWVGQLVRCGGVAFRTRASLVDPVARSEWSAVGHGGHQP